MKLIACALLLAGTPSVLAGQVGLSVPRLQRPVLRATLGPLAVVATFGGHGVALRATPDLPRMTSNPRRTPGAASASAARVLTSANRYVGTRYRYGGEAPVTGFDCSGFVQYVYSRHGIALPRTSRLQSASGVALPLDVGSLRPGDLLLFATSGSGVDHVAIYAGENRMIHSSAGAGGVVYDDLSTPRGKWYLRHHVGSRRVL